MAVIRCLWLRSHLSSGPTTTSTTLCYRHSTTNPCKTEGVVRYPTSTLPVARCRRCDTHAFSSTPPQYTCTVLSSGCASSSAAAAATDTATLPLSRWTSSAYRTHKIWTLPHSDRCLHPPHPATSYRSSASFASGSWECRRSCIGRNRTDWLSFA